MQDICDQIIYFVDELLQHTFKCNSIKFVWKFTEINNKLREDEG